MNKMNGLLAPDLTGEEAEIIYYAYLKGLKKNLHHFDC